MKTYKQFIAEANRFRNLWKAQGLSDPENTNRKLFYPKNADGTKTATMRFSGGRNKSNRKPLPKKKMC